MGFQFTFDGDWQHYWSNYSDVKLLKDWSADMDQLLQRLEKELKVKLLARDHLEIIEALENRIEELEQQSQASKKSEPAGVQGELFPA